MWACWGSKDLIMLLWKTLHRHFHTQGMENAQVRCSRSLAAEAVALAGIGGLHLSVPSACHVQ